MIYDGWFVVALSPAKRDFQVQSVMKSSYCLCLSTGYHFDCRENRLQLRLHGPETEQLVIAQATFLRNKSQEKSSTCFLMGS